MTETAAANWNAPAVAWWHGLALRERRLVASMAALLVLAAVFLWAVQPAWRTITRAPAELEALDAQLQTMRRLATEAQQLRAMPPVNAEQAAAVLKAATERLGDKARLAVQGDRAVLTLTGVVPSAMRAWLAEARSGARARPVEANLSRAGAGYSGTLVVVIGGGA